MLINSLEQLRELYALPNERALHKQLDQLEEHSINFINRSPFILISTVNQKWQLDCSPRGGSSGFVKVIDKTRIIIPDFKGNNRLDSLQNIIQTKMIGCLFLIPGIDETLRINGRATITTEPNYIDQYSAVNNLPKCVIVVEIAEVFLHCAKSMMRARLWSDEAKLERSTIPSMGKMLNDQLKINTPPESHQAMLQRYSKDL